MSRSPKASGSSPRRSGEDSGAYQERLSRLAELITGAGLSGLLVTNPKDVGYLTGFLGGDSYLLVPAELRSSGSGLPVLISDFRYKEEVEPVEAAGLARLFIRSRSMMDAVAEVLGATSGRIGVQAEHMTIAERAAIGRKLGGSRSKGSPEAAPSGGGGAKRLADTIGLVGKLRVRKDETEVSLIRKAIRVQEAALQAVLPTIKAGQTELEVAAALEAEMKRRGSAEPGFQTIVAAGANGSLPHYRPGTRKLASGKPVLIDWGAVVKGYHGDMTRTFTLGKWPAKVREIYQIVLEAQLAAAAALAPGKTTVQVDQVARNLITRHGYGEFFGHGLGHGIGLAGHEEPRLTNTLAPVKLEPGMVVTVEPGIYLPGIGGVRIEDDYVITEEGAENLCAMKKDLEWATLG